MILFGKPGHPEFIDGLHNRFGIARWNKPGKWIVIEQFICGRCVSRNDWAAASNDLIYLVWYHKLCLKCSSKYPQAYIGLMNFLGQACIRNPVNPVNIFTV